jgi:hypothetical protein
MNARSDTYVIKVRERHDAGFWGPWLVIDATGDIEVARGLAGAIRVSELVQAGIFLRGKRIDKPKTKDQRIRELEERLASAECIIRQVARDTWGREMTPKEFAEASSYDS